jgi:hypothetical protein
MSGDPGELPGWLRAVSYESIGTGVALIHREPGAALDGGRTR